MKTLMNSKLYVLPAIGIVLALTSAAGASASPPHKASKKAASSKNILIAPSVGATMNSTPSVIPGIDILPLAQAQKAAAAAAAGQKALDVGDLSDAEIEFQYSTRLNDTDSTALVGLAQTLEQEGKIQQAIPVYRYLLNPKQGWETSLESDPLLRIQFALMLAGDGQWREAVSVYENTIGRVAIGPSYPRLDVHFSPDIQQLVLFQAMSHLAIGVIYNGRLEHGRALIEYAAAVGKRPDLALAYYCYGHGLQLLGRHTEAQTAFQKAVVLDHGEVKAAAEKALAGR